MTRGPGYLFPCMVPQCWWATLDMRWERAIERDRLHAGSLSRAHPFQKCRPGALERTVPPCTSRAIAFGFLEAPLKGKLLLPTADLGDSVPLLQDVKANKPENTAGNQKCRPRKFQMRLPCLYILHTFPSSCLQLYRRRRVVHFCSATPERSPPPRRSIITPPFTLSKSRSVSHGE